METHARAVVVGGGAEQEIEILGERKQVVVIEESPYDPNNNSLRG